MCAVQPLGMRKKPYINSKRAPVSRRKRPTNTCAMRPLSAEPSLVILDESTSALGAFPSLSLRFCLFFLDSRHVSLGGVSTGN